MKNHDLPPTDESIATAFEHGRNLAAQLSAEPCAKKRRLLADLQNAADRNRHAEFIDSLLICGDANIGSSAIQTGYIRREARALHDVLVERPLRHERDWRDLRDALQPVAPKKPRVATAPAVADVVEYARPPARGPVSDRERFIEIHLRDNPKLEPDAQTRLIAMTMAGTLNVWQDPVGVRAVMQEGVHARIIFNDGALKYVPLIDFDQY